MTTDFARIARSVLVRHPPEAALRVRLGDVTIAVRSNSVALIRTLTEYFRPFLDSHTSSDVLIDAVVTEEQPALGLPYQVWQREPGRRLKEMFADIEGGRVIKKIRTGMSFLVGGDIHMAFGPCLDNPNQVINFVVSRQISSMVNRGWLLCHAAGVVDGDQGLAVAGVSGAGKSTLALHLLAQDLGFVSNDRLLVRREPSGFDMFGVPKQPRVNPGTVLNNQSLFSVIPRERRRELAVLEPDVLWQLEEKYDVDVERIFGEGTFHLGAKLSGLVVLAWNPRDPSPPRWDEIRLPDHRELVGRAIGKSPGPFHESEDGLPATAGEVSVDPAPYLEQLWDLPVLLFTGGVDFALAARVARERFLAEASSR
jgi:HprK-related kinase B